jgi:signal transduction histidine kinase
MRFRAWRGLTESYRAAVEGHSPWSPDERAPEPIIVPDVAIEPSLRTLLPTLGDEGVAALAFFPLVASGHLVGKFMVYYGDRHEPTELEIEVARAIADHVAMAVSRFEAIDGLRDTVRFNEVFTGVLGHDLRNPMQAISTAAHLLRGRLDPNPRDAALVDRILASGQRMARMIDQLLDFTRMRVGSGVPIFPSMCDLGDVLRQVTGEIEQAHSDAHISLEARGDLRGTWDSDRLAQVFSNLVANAVQHGERSHGVRVEADGTDSASVRVVVHNAGSIPDALLPMIFEPLAGGAQRRDGTRGLGLGLYIAKAISSAHGGRIEASSNATEGTTFVVRLPRAAAV